MTFNPGKTPPYVLPDQRSDFEESQIPNRAATITQGVVDNLVHAGPSQGTPALSSQPIIAGCPNYGIARWW